MESDLFSALVSGNCRKTEYLTEQELKAGKDPEKLVYGVIVPAMEEVGKRFECDVYFVPELLIAARAMKCALAVLKPALISDHKTKGRVAIGAVCGELHDIGINIIREMLECSGFQVINLGVDVHAEKFVKAVRENEANIIMMSASNLPQINYLRYVIDALEHAGLRQKVKVLVGGVSVTPEFANSIGADGYADNAVNAVRLAQRFAPIA